MFNTHTFLLLTLTLGVATASTFAIASTTGGVVGAFMGASTAVQAGVVIGVSGAIVSASVSAKVLVADGKKDDSVGRISVNVITASPSESPSRADVDLALNAPPVPNPVESFEPSLLDPSIPNTSLSPSDILPFCSGNGLVETKNGFVTLTFANIPDFALSSSAKTVIASSVTETYNMLSNGCRDRYQRFLVGSYWMEWGDANGIAGSESEASLVGRILAKVRCRNCPSKGPLLFDSKLDAPPRIDLLDFITAVEALLRTKFGADVSDGESLLLSDLFISAGSETNGEGNPLLWTVRNDIIRSTGPSVLKIPSDRATFPPTAPSGFTEPSSDSGPPYSFTRSFSPSVNPELYFSRIPTTGSPVIRQSSTPLSDHSITPSTLRTFASKSPSKLSSYLSPTPPTTTATPVALPSPIAVVVSPVLVSPFALTVTTFPQETELPTVGSVRPTMFPSRSVEPSPSSSTIYAFTSAPSRLLSLTGTSLPTVSPSHGVGEVVESPPPAPPYSGSSAAPAGVEFVTLSPASAATPSVAPANTATIAPSSAPFSRSTAPTGIESVPPSRAPVSAVSMETNSSSDSPSIEKGDFSSFPPSATTLPSSLNASDASSLPIPASNVPSLSGSAPSEPPSGFPSLSPLPTSLSSATPKLMTSSPPSFPAPDRSTPPSAGCTVDDLGFYGSQDGESVAVIFMVDVLYRPDAQEADTMRYSLDTAIRNSLIPVLFSICSGGELTSTRERRMAMMLPLHQTRHLAAIGIGPFNVQDEASVIRKWRVSTFACSFIGLYLTSVLTLPIDSLVPPPIFLWFCQQQHSAT
jgi:hypothetical protein